MPSAHEAPPDLWIAQAESDFEIAKRIYDPANPATFCQAIAKLQQTVEKSVKALAVALRSGGDMYKHDLTELVGGLVRTPGRSAIRHRRDAFGQVCRLLNLPRRDEIRELSDLAPTQQNQRNTEYPFLTRTGAWMAPCMQGAFTQDEVARFAKLADHLLYEAKKIISGIRKRTTRPS